MILLPERHIEEHRRRRGSRRLGLAFLCATLMTTVAPAAHGEGASPLNIEAVVVLPEPPCPTGDAEEPCTGSLAGTVTGALAGETGGGWSGALADAELVGTFTHENLLGECGGVAAGTATVSAGVGNVLGYFDAGDNLPRPVLELAMSLDFTWQRAGTVAELAVANVTVAIDVAGIGWITVVSDGVGRGAATFDTDGADAASLASCGPGPVDTTMTGTVQLIGLTGRG